MSIRSIRQYQDDKGRMITVYRDVDTKVSVYLGHGAMMRRLPNGQQRVNFQFEIKANGIKQAFRRYDEARDARHVAVEAEMAERQRQHQTAVQRAPAGILGPDGNLVNVHPGPQR